MIYNRAPRETVVCFFGSAPKKSKISLPTCHRWESAHARTAPFPKIHPAFFSALCAHFLQKRNHLIHNVRDAIFNQAIHLDGDDNEFVDAQATKAISKTRGEPNHARVFCQRWKAERFSTTNFFGNCDESSDPAEKRRSQNCQRSRRSIFRGYLHRALPNQFRYVSSLSPFLFRIRRWEIWWISIFLFFKMGALISPPLLLFLFFLDWLTDEKQNMCKIILCLCVGNL